MLGNSVGASVGCPVGPAVVQTPQKLWHLL
jgi:hypothetical protein